MKEIRKALREAKLEKDGNARMLRLLRTVHRWAQEDDELRVRLERASGRPFPCDYTHLFDTVEPTYAKLAKGESCTAWAYDPRRQAEQCLFDTRLEEAVWLTSVWGCMAFTETRGEGESCYRLCDYDDYCAAQVACAAADFDLVLCALGVCLPEKVAGIY